MNILDVLTESAKRFPDRIIFEDNKYGEYSYSFADSMSSKICSFLMSEGIGTEDIVVIRMERSARIYLAMLGVMKAGAAFAVIGEHSPADYVHEVLEETKPKLIFDGECFEKAMGFPETSVYHTAEPTDLACVVYSTGSSGIFKGSMHEYGAFDNMIKKFEYANKKPFFITGEVYEYSRTIMQAGFYAIGAIVSLMWSVLLGQYLYILPYDAIEDDDRHLEIIREKKVRAVGASPKFYSHIKNAELPDVKCIDLSFDIEIDELDDRYRFSNAYAMTEAFGALTCSYIDRKYDITPVGKPYPLTDISVIGKDGKRLEPGQIGEICFVPVHFRGYINRPELTASVYYNGLFHTGDIGYTDSDGMYFVLGRKIDMLESKDGYIVPTFISVEIKKAFPDIIKNYVKLFASAQKTKICVYYCGEHTYTIEDFRRALKNRLGDTMLPTHCVKLDDFEYFPCGKINRLSFNEPI